MEQILQNNTFLIVSSFLVSFVISYLSIPPIVALAREKKLFAIPNGRSAHKLATPSLGGIAIFSGFILSTLIFSTNVNFPQLTYLTAATLIIFFFGLKDDIFVLTAGKKLLAQIISAFIVVAFADLRLTSLHGCMGINEIPYLTSIILSIFVIIVITNAFNLIDGIDGLATSVGIVSLSTLAIWFFMADYIYLATAAIAMIGALIGFLPFNLSKGKNKIFMGDTGSLLLGFVISGFTIFFSELNLLASIPESIRVSSAPTVAIGIIFLPLYDTLRVMSIRIYRGRSPFKADMEHLHHKLLDLGYSHLASTIILSIFSMIFVALSFYLQNIGIIMLLLVQITIATSFYYIPITLISRNIKSLITEKKKV